ncbi:MAG: hypothetical protein SGI88_17020 [Candidatus Hydrogenedentes bacterium]|nr:hypothetical protein [Candidatus Hydrogenedentota bacterium]
MAKAKAFRLEAAGWGFWAATSAVLLGPSIYLANRLVEEHHSWDVPAGIGLVFATMGSAVITFAANTIIQRNAARKRSAAKTPNKNRK